MSSRSLVVVLFPVAACAQNRVETRATFGHAAFLDESLLNHAVAGGSARFYLTRRLSFEPEFLYLRASRRDRDWMLLPSVAFDLRRPAGRVTPYVIGGLGSGRAVPPDRARPPGRAKPNLRLRLCGQGSREPLQAVTAPVPRIASRLIFRLVRAHSQSASGPTPGSLFPPRIAFGRACDPQ